MPSNLIKRSFIVIFSIIWIAIVGEIFLRIFEPQALVPRYIQAGDFGIRVNMPNQTYWHKTPDYKIQFRTNSKGIRSNHEIPYEKPADTKRIVVLGDSFGFGYGVSLEDTFTQQLRKRFATEGEKVEIVNLSASGYGTDEQLLVLQNEGIKYQPDYVISTWHKSDPVDNLRSGLFKLSDGKLVRKNKTYLPAVKMRETLFKFAIYRWLANDSHFYNWIRAFVATKVKRTLNTMKKNESSPSKSAEERTKKIQKRKLNLSMALLKEIQLTAKQSGSEFILLDIPIKESRTKFTSSMPIEITNSFPVVNPIESFKQHKGKLIYWENSHGHFSPFGCSIVADNLFNKIKKL